ncbi:MAG: hypothetical protein DHS20C14_12810 [Phycisphaeraceae bacterium]|nr:MAG: hypothetical protein DHS20C14_12810 [Phycisphaeraceae bacterium]
MGFRSRLLLVNLLGTGLTAVLVITLFLHSVQFRSHWNDYRSSVMRRQELLQDISDGVGYGGMIHALKNYVLRREPQYFKQFEQGIERTHTAVVAYREIEGVEDHERQQLDAIDTMLDLYSEAMRTAVASESSPAELDAKIRIDDTPYFNARDELHRSTLALSAAGTTRMEDDLRAGMTVALITGVVSAIVMIGVGTWLPMRVARALEQKSADHKREAERAQAATVAKSQFLANMSHEIRTPMSAIIGFSQALSEEDVSDAERNEFQNAIKRNAESLLGILNDILDISRVESGHLELYEEVVDIPTTIAGVASVVGLQARRKGIKLILTEDDNVPQRVWCDGGRLRQILVNLVSNAIKFTDTGHAEVAVSYVPVAGDTGRLCVDVSDTGSGIPAEDLERIFESFEQGDASSTRVAGGVGLGLGISRRLARLMGGDITAESTQGQGSRFRLTIPIRVARETQPTPSAQMDTRRGANSLRGAWILLVEDGPDNQRLMLHLMNMMEVRLDVAANGAEAIDHLREHGEPDLILMDMQMPVLDGYQATRQIRRMGLSVPVVALTAHAMEGDRERCLAAGCDGYVTKPIDREKLFETCERLLNEGPSVAEHQGH